MPVPPDSRRRVTEARGRLNASAPPATGHPGFRALLKSARVWFLKDTQHLRGRLAEREPRDTN